MKDFDSLIDQVRKWSQSQPLIRGVFLVGSHARKAARADSDVDLVILTNDRQSFLKDLSWVTDFGEVEKQVVEDWGRVKSVRVFYKNGLEIEFGFTDTTWASIPI